MELFAVKANKMVEEFDKINEKIKFIDYGSNFISLVTINNQIFHFSITLYGNNYESRKMMKIDNFNFGNIKSLHCSDKNTFIVNENNKIYKICFKEINRLEKEFTIFEIKLKDYYFEKIKFIRSKKEEIICVTKTNLYFVNLWSSEQYKMKLNFIIKDLQSGISHTVILDNNGLIYGMGCSVFFGFKNVNSVIPNNHFKLISLPFKVNKIFCFENQTIILNEFNEFFGAGLNQLGGLGLGHTNQVLEFTKIVIDPHNHVQNIYEDKSGNFSIALMNNLDIYVCGTSDILETEKLNFEVKVKKVSNSHRYYLDSFTKWSIPKSTKKFIMPFTFYNELFILRTDDEFNNNEDEDCNDLPNHCYLKLKSNQLSDLQIFI